MLTAEKDGWHAVRYAIWRRDGGCIAIQADKVGEAAAATFCRDKFQNVITYDAIQHLELDHVKEQPRVGASVKKRTDKHSYKAPDDEAHLVLLCPHHHATWATAHRPEERTYLAQRYPEVWNGVS